MEDYHEEGQTEANVAKTVCSHLNYVNKMINSLIDFFKKGKNFTRLGACKQNDNENYKLHGC
jgi:hypothetical protein